MKNRGELGFEPRQQRVESQKTRSRYSARLRKKRGEVPLSRVSALIPIVSIGLQLIVERDDWSCLWLVIDIFDERDRSWGRLSGFDRHFEHGDDCSLILRDVTTQRRMRKFLQGRFASRIETEQVSPWFDGTIVMLRLEMWRRSVETIVGGGSFYRLHRALEFDLPTKMSAREKRSLCGAWR